MSQPIDVRKRKPYDVNQLSIQDTYREDLEEVLIPRGEINNRIKRLAEEITDDYRDRAGRSFYPICVLKGGMRFFSDLMSVIQLTVPYREGIVLASRYGTSGADGSDETLVTFPDPDALRGMDVLLIEDIIDEGYTLEAITEQLHAYEPNSVEIAVLFDKAANRKVGIDTKYVGFIIPDEFVVGYGLDYNERYRNVDHLSVVDPDRI